jgi:DNA-directed RNA polymerase specialized sigma subunit
MKIALNMGQADGLSGKHQLAAFEREILAAKGGDWEAKNNLARRFAPLLTSLAQKRTADTGEINKFIEAGKKGLLKAAGKYKSNIHPDKFQVFALDFIEREMNIAAKGGGGFLARLFGR